MPGAGAGARGLAAAAARGLPASGAVGEVEAEGAAEARGAATAARGTAGCWACGTWTSASSSGCCCGTAPTRACPHGW